MGIFNRIGREVEQFRQNAKEAAEESTTYECQACESTFHVEYDECPECGSSEVIARTDGK